MQPTQQPTCQPSCPPTSQPSTGFQGYSNILRIIDFSISKSCSCAQVVFSHPTNCAGGPGWFQCSRLFASFKNNSLNPESLQCFWANATSLYIQYPMNSINAIETLPSLFIRNDSRLMSLIEDTHTAFNESEIAHWSGEEGIGMNIMSYQSSANGFVIFDLSRVSDEMGSEWKSVTVHMENLMFNNSLVLNDASVVSNTLYHGIKQCLLLGDKLFAWDVARSFAQLLNLPLNSIQGKSASLIVNVTVCNTFDICGTSRSNVKAKLRILPSTIAFVSSPVVHFWSPVKNDGGYSVGKSLTLYGDSFVPFFSSNGSLISKRRSLLSYAWNFSCSIDVSAAEIIYNKDLLLIPPHVLPIGAFCIVNLVVKDLLFDTIGESENLRFVVQQSSPPSFIPSQMSVMISSLEMFTLELQEPTSNRRKLLTLGTNDSDNVFAWSCHSTRFPSSLLSDAMLRSLSPSYAQNLFPSCTMAMSSVNSAAWLVSVFPIVAHDFSSSTIEVVMKDPNNSVNIAKRTVNVVVVDRSIPMISIITPSSSLRQRDVSIVTTIEAEIYAPIVTSSSSSLFQCRATWHVLSGGSAALNEFLNKSSALVQLQHRIRTQSGVSQVGNSSTQVTLSIPPYQLVSGGFYIFRLNCGESYSDVVTTFNRPPFGGWMSVYPSKGQSLITEFTLSAPHWQDDPEDLPLLYTFSFSPTSSVSTGWRDIPGMRRVWTLPAVLLPSIVAGNQSFFEMPLKCTVRDSLGGVGQGWSSITLWNSPAEGSSFLSSRLQTLLRNSTQETALRAQQMVTTVSTYLEPGVTMLTLTDRLKLATELVSIANSSLFESNQENIQLIGGLMRNLTANLKYLELNVAQETAQASITSGIKGSNSSRALFDSTTKVLSTLTDLLLQQGINSIQVTTDSIKLLVALLTGNSSLFSIPDSKSSITLGGSKGDVVSIAQVDASLFSLKNSSNSNSTHNVELASNVVSIRIITGNSSIVVIPSFVANLSVVPISAENPIFEHNCSLGIEEKVSFLCPSSQIWMNLTCSGKATAVFRRQCPVAKRVCSVLSLSSGLVSSNNNFCQTVVSGSSVICKCGFGNSTSSKNLADGGAVNLAVTTQYVPGNEFGVVVISGTSLSAGKFASKSSAIFAVFGCLWACGILAICYHFFSFQKKQSKATASAVKTVESNQKQSLQASLKFYAAICLPDVFHSDSQLNRLWEQIRNRHKYVHIVYCLIYNQRIESEEIKKHEVLMIAHILTAITMSCFVLAVLYDLQYPSDDGTCKLYMTQDTCLSRKTLLDSQMTLCIWKNFHSTSAGTITESHNNQLLDSMSLEQALDENFKSQCHFNTDNTSFLASVLSVVITSLASAPVAVVLKHLIKILTAEPKDQKEAGHQPQSFVSFHFSTSTIEVETQNKPKQDMHSQPSLTDSSTTSFTLSKSPIAPTYRKRRGDLAHWDMQDKKKKVDTIVVPFEIREARAVVVDIMQQQHRSPQHGLATMLSRSSESMTELLSVSAKKELQTLQSQIANVTDLIFGYILMEEMYIDILGRESSLGKLFRMICVSEREGEEFVAPWVQWVAVAILVALNLGSLYFVALKGVNRGLSWQLNFLQVCAMELATEIVITQTFEVYWVDYALPNLVYKEVQHALRIMQKIAERVAEPPTSVRQISWKGQTNTKSKLSQVLAASRPVLVESIWAQHLSITMQNTILGKSAVISPIQRWSIENAAKLPMVVHQTLAYAFSTFAIGALIYAWFACNRFAHGRVILIVVVGGVTLFLIVRSISSWRVQKRIKSSLPEGGKDIQVYPLVSSRAPGESSRHYGWSDIQLSASQSGSLESDDVLSPIDSFADCSSPSSFSPDSDDAGSYLESTASDNWMAEDSHDNFQLHKPQPHPTSHSKRKRSQSRTLEKEWNGMDSMEQKMSDVDFLYNPVRAASFLSLSKSMSNSFSSVSLSTSLSGTESPVSFTDVASDIEFDQQTPEDMSYIAPNGGIDDKIDEAASDDENELDEFLSLSVSEDDDSEDSKEESGAD